jgi:hypothetical protein
MLSKKTIHKLIFNLKGVIADLNNHFEPNKESWSAVIELCQIVEGSNTKNEFEPVTLSSAEIDGATEMINKVDQIKGQKVDKPDSVYLLSHAAHLLELYLNQTQYNKKKSEAA